ncbi:hypothetical protein M231_00371 [Tremella mesenterica]|uniref:Uncharacterized protein n=1 Tax=Tremella mesenterica TaxID=5217 RepID=A0A4Q1BW47_TREME|nr:uncharacterized protein TREMEDRAFT_63483 [Tremella mesenterica DSM 1558]EIW68310.1 hypothetical protein TREMEDRAFT_63483 [Tremella mesenterica DSM 1558]RXK42381.1 hypothetical protein M231_00371 [Tremella mesenterica]
MSCRSALLISCLFFLSFFQAVTALPASELTNAERFKRGLGPKVPSRRFNATATGQPLSKRSVGPSKLYLQASPASAPPKRSLDRREATPHNTESFVYYDDSNGVFALTINPGLAVSFKVQGSGSNQVILTPIDGTTFANECFIYSGSQTPAMEIDAEGGPSTCGFTPGTDYDQTVAESQNDQIQAPIWNVPENVPGPASINFHNHDGTTTNPSWFVYDTYEPDRFDQLGAALKASHFGANGAVTELTLTWVNQLPG